MSFGKRLINIRKQKGVSQKDLASAIGKDPAQVRRYERDYSEPSAKTAFKIANKLGITIEELVFDEAIFENEITKKLSENFKKIILLPENKQKSILDIIEAFVNQNK